MEISPARLGEVVQVAVQKNVLEQIKAQGASLVSLINTGSVNLPHQGQHIDARV